MSLLTPSRTAPPGGAIRAWPPAPVPSVARGSRAPFFRATLAGSSAASTGSRWARLVRPAMPARRSPPPWVFAHFVRGARLALPAYWIWAAAAVASGLPGRWALLPPVSIAGYGSCLFPSGSGGPVAGPPAGASIGRPFRVDPVDAGFPACPLGALGESLPWPLGPIWAWRRTTDFPSEGNHLRGPAADRRSPIRGWWCMRLHVFGRTLTAEAAGPNPQSRGRAR